MAESLLLPVVRGVVGKAADALVQKVTRMWGVDGDRRDLELKLLYVQSLLADAEVKAEAETEAGRAVKVWMKELRAAAYQADDVLDDFQYEALRREALSLRSATSKVLDYFTSRNPLVFRHKASRDLKNVLDKIHKLVEDMKKFGLLQREPVATQQALYRQTHSALDESADIFGRDNDKEVVVKLLLDQQDQRNVQVLPIIGMGSLGKTTLAKMVFNDHKVQKHFELKMWHCVSDNIETTAVVRSIIELATNARCDLPDTIELLRGKLQEVVGRKRFLLVLDDVWNEEQQKWEDHLKPLLCSSNAGLGSMIVVTSRSQKVASIMGTLSPHELSCLNDDDSWELFSKRAFSKGVQKQAEFIQIGKFIVNRCKGLPLALKTMGGLMSSKHQTKEWEAIAKDERVGKDEVLSILKLSYMHLSSEMKQCFAFCAVFPKDYGMDKDKLIQLWMANNFIHAEGTTHLVQKGEFIFNELVWRSFIQDVNVEIFDEYNFAPPKKIICKMHDLMHDLAQETTDECAVEAELIPQKTFINNVRHIQLPWSNPKQNITRLMENSSPIRTLLTQSEPLSKSDLKALKKLKLTSLRALCWGNRSVIHIKLIDTAHLRYLDLSRSGVVRLPTSVCMLYNLQSLILNHCRELEILPEGMQTMSKLTHICLMGCDRLKRMPPKLSLLHNLCTLTKFIVDYRDGFGIEELKDLRQLGYRLELFNLRKVKSGSKVNLHEKKNLTELVLNWGPNRIYIPNPLHDEVINNNEEEVLESLVPHAELKTLGLQEYPGLSISQWMRNPQMFQCLRELYISNCPRCKDLPLVWLSSSLEKLCLRRMDSLSALCKNIDMEATRHNSSLAIFPKLKTMWLVGLPELERWAENSAGEPNSLVVFPQLEELNIYDCNKIATLPESPALTSLHCVSKPVEGLVPMSIPLGSSPSLVRLYIGMQVDMVLPAKDHENQSQRPLLDSLRSLCVWNDNGFISVFNSSKLQLGLGDCLAFVEDLKIWSCNNILHWPVEEFRCLVSLRSLDIAFCNKLEGKGSSSEEILPLPQLERLVINECASLLEIPKLPTSLGKLRIDLCGSLVALPSNLGGLPKLSHLSLGCCNELKALPGGMDGLTSLERLKISFCPGIDKFPQVLLQRLPALRSLDIRGCPDLQRCCGEGGEYFDFVSPIPEKRIPAATEPQMKNYVKRFLPLCGGGSQSN
ncbi:disease resistance protein RGA2 [Sorghum bicolor]|jgi:hypothetical protein|uniref:Uncharacterized protein n=1 Tax=Sorghum bicolor TaxID=4558 RepID=C5YHN9_SORBI|nr:disease resistance protein RGA2 [Sorghum bicolor]XP_021319981.1 disease resistance protein RGA2 [Sorghum bicolor]EES14172.1 hypothetical protein SORBI_3007G189200 [Sorghum bicolor]|eukprot:XP_002444677.1 disease resistance protein RGA2 [Sorghum bicolor]